VTSKSRKQDRDGPYRRIIARNKRARHDYAVEQTYEAGLMLLGSEVKTLRGGKASIKEAHARIRRGEAWLLNCNIPEYSFSNQFNHAPKRERKLLLHRSELRKLEAKTKIGGYTLVPLEIYFDERGKVKVLIGLARGKRQHDKRQSLRLAEHEREMGRQARETD